MRRNTHLKNQEGQCATVQAAKGRAASKEAESSLAPREQDRPGTYSNEVYVPERG